MPQASHPLVLCWTADRERDLSLLTKPHQLDRVSSRWPRALAGQEVSVLRLHETSRLGPAHSEARCRANRGQFFLARRAVPPHVLVPVAPPAAPAVDRAQRAKLETRRRQTHETRSFGSKPGLW